MLAKKTSRVPLMGACMWDGSEPRDTDFPLDLQGLTAIFQRGVEVRKLYP